MRFWNVNSGEIKISGVNVNEINTENLRNNEGFVTQDTHLFHDTIENNIRIAKLGATSEEIIAACKKASVHDFIMSLPNGCETQVGELGETLSGGERQRIGLARAFLHNAPLILLDEPTSNLDSLNEAVILKSLADNGGENTAAYARVPVSAACGGLLREKLGAFGQMVQKHKALQKQPRIVCQGSGNDLENQDQDYDNRHGADDNRIYYDETIRGRTDRSCLHLDLPYSVFYFRRENH